MQFTKSLKTAGVLALLFPVFLKAELSSFADQQYHDKSPEKLEISIIALTTKQTEAERGKMRWTKPQEEMRKRIITNIEAQAKVQKVFRTESNLTEGQIINIHYQIKGHGKSFLGPSQPIHIKTGKTYTAYLASKEDFYVLSECKRNVLCQNREGACQHRRGACHHRGPCQHRRGARQHKGAPESLHHPNHDIEE